MAPDAQAQPDELAVTPLEEGGKDCVESCESESSGESEAEVDFNEFCQAGGNESRAPVASMGVDVDLFQNPKTKSLHARAKGSAQDAGLPFV